jgi:hypothetical protein
MQFCTRFRIRLVLCLQLSEKILIPAPPQTKRPLFAALTFTGKHSTLLSHNTRVRHDWRRLSIVDFSLLSHVAYFKSGSRKDALKALYPALTLIEDHWDPCSQGKKDFFTVEVVRCCLMRWRALLERNYHNFAG